MGRFLFSLITRFIANKYKLVCLAQREDIRAHLSIDGRLAAQYSADCQGVLNGWRSTGKYLVFTVYCPVGFLNPPP